MEREGERRWRGGWVPPALCRCACIQPHVPACPSWTLVLGAGSSHPGAGQWDHSAVVPGFMTGWASDMFLHPTSHLSAQRALSLLPLAPSSMALPDLWPQGLSLSLFHSVFSLSLLLSQK